MSVWGVNRTEGTPHDELGEISAKMLDVLDVLGEEDLEVVIVLGRRGHGSIVHAGFDNDGQVLERLTKSMTALTRSGIDRGEVPPDPDLGVGSDRPMSEMPSDPTLLAEAIDDAFDSYWRERWPGAPRGVAEWPASFVREYLAARAAWRACARLQLSYQGAPSPHRKD